MTPLCGAKKTGTRSRSASQNSGQRNFWPETLQHGDGVGLGDEFPAIPFSWELNENSFDGVLQPGMVMCVETYVGRFSGGPGVKLEEQVLITNNGYELLTSYPFESDLLL